MDASLRSRSGPGSWPDYRAVWRWHFYASLFCMPFVVVLSISGSIYLFKPQIEAWIERDYDHLVVTGNAAPVKDQVQAALDAIPGSTLRGYELPATATSAARVIVDDSGQAIRAFVHPEKLQVLHTVAEDDRFMRWIFRLHGELLAGDWGSHVVETAACWTIVMILTGLFLWWPRHLRGLGGILYPRLNYGRQTMWRDLHSVVGVWISWLALLLLLSGLPWAKFWGDYFKTVRQLTGTAVARQEWSNSSSSPSRMQKSGGSHGEHGGHGHRSHARASSPKPPVDLTPIDRVVEIVRPLQLDPPVVINPPSDGGNVWSAKAMPANRPRRVNLRIDGTTGEVVSREGFSDRHWIDRIVAVGIAAHEGQLFGWPNQLLGVLTAAGLVLMCISGLVLWWRRRESGSLGAPKRLTEPHFSWTLLLIVIALGIYLPLFGLTLFVVLLIERLVLRRLPRVRDWLGLSPPTVCVEENWR